MKDMLQVRSNAASSGYASRAQGRSSSHRTVPGYDTPGSCGLSHDLTSAMATIRPGTRRLSKSPNQTLQIVSIDGVREGE
jgi:hypothetical protein